MVPGEDAGAGLGLEGPEVLEEGISIRVHWVVLENCVWKV